METAPHCHLQHPEDLREMGEVRILGVFSPQDESVYKAELELIKTNPKMNLSSRDDRKRGAGERISYT